MDETNGFTVRPERKFSNIVTGWDDNGFRATVHFPGLIEQSWPFDSIDDPEVLFRAVLRFKGDLGIWPTYPVRSAREFAELSLPHQPPVLCDDPAEYWRPFIEKMESEFIWLREPNRTERGAKFAVAFDKRMMFLSAARSAMFGVGAPSIVENIGLSELGRSVGLVKIRRPKFADPLRPDLAAFFTDIFADQDIFYSSYLPVIQDLCPEPIKIIKGFVWSDPVRLFEPFAKKLGDAIKMTRPDPRFDVPAEMSGSEVLAAVNASYKSLYVRFFGWLGRLDNRTGFAANWFRPDWRGLIVSEAGANLFRNIVTVHKQTGLLPFGINHDCLMYFADSDNWQMDFTSTPITDPNRFTCEWIAPAAKVRKMIRAGLNSGQIDGEFKDA